LYIFHAFFLGHPVYTCSQKGRCRKTLSLSEFWRRVVSLPMPVAYIGARPPKVPKYTIFKWLSRETVPERGEACVNDITWNLLWRPISIAFHGVGLRADHVSQKARVTRRLFSETNRDDSGGICSVEREPAYDTKARVMGIDSMRVGGGRCPPLLVGGLLLACLMLICSWWTLSSENLELIRQIDDLNEQLKIRWA